jgi:hypothetical protein
LGILFQEVCQKNKEINLLKNNIFLPWCEISHQKKSLIKPFPKCKHIHQKNQFSWYENGSNKVKVANFGSNVIVPTHVGGKAQQSHTHKDMYTNRAHTRNMLLFYMLRAWIFTIYKWVLWNMKKMRVQSHMMWINLSNMQKIESCSHRTKF